MEGKCSCWRGILAGVPQGSILGPLLFLIFINDIVADINTFIRLFADDTSLMISSANLLNDSVNLQRDINSISEWAKKWAVTFNLDKNTYMLISRRQVNRPIPLNFNGSPIKQVKKHKHLGLTFNSDAKL